jgi:hypothetical protein
MAHALENGPLIVSVACLLSFALCFRRFETGQPQSTKSKAATWYQHYYSVYMYAAFNKGVDEQNSSNPSTETAGINLEIASINRFDNYIQTIKFPKSDKHELNQVLIENSVLTNLDGTLAINTSNVSNYNSLFDGVESAQATSTAAIDLLAKDLGMNWN